MSFSRRVMDAVRAGAGFAAVAPTVLTPKKSTHPLLSHNRDSRTTESTLEL